MGKMLLQETQKFDIQTHVLDPSPDAPCQVGCNRFEVGDLLNYDTVLAFGRTVDLLTIEIENVNADALHQLEKEGVQVYPGSRTLKTIQNKANQKLFYTDHDIPTAPFARYAYTSEIKDSLANGGRYLPFVWKRSLMGYDGQGVQVVRQEEDLKGLPNVECIAEDLIPFKKELAVIVARNVRGEQAVYPVVEMEFHPGANQVEYVICPARIGEAVAAKARQLAKKVSDELQNVGLLAVEMFQTADDQILVNEVAPRPHNSGHYSIEASYTSQFEQHLRAILGLPLGSTASKVAGVMVNLVGAEGFTGEVVYEHLEEIMGLQGVTPHIYGKKITRPFRKMGHVTIVNEDPDVARKLAEKVKNKIKVIAK